MALLAFLWGRGRDTWYWTDEALSLGISSHPLAAMADVLRQDTSPPLYHLLLRAWMSLFGSSEASTHTLSLLFALAVVPAALWAGWSLFERRTGWMCALLAALSPFLATYANETRMYALVALLSVLDPQPAREQRQPRRRMVNSESRGDRAHSLRGHDAQEGPLSTTQTLARTR